ncbi:hypothetical protein ABIE59_004008, partial [Marinobacter sp. MBR-99]
TAINQAVNRTPKAYRFGFPPLRFGAGYLSVMGQDDSSMEFLKKPSEEEVETLLPNGLG